MTEWVRNAVLGSMAAAQEKRQMDEFRQLNHEHALQKEAEHKAMASEMMDNWVAAQKHSDKPMGTWYVCKYFTSAYGMGNICDVLPVAVDKEEWCRQFFYARNKLGGVKYRTMLDGWNPEWGDIHEELGKANNFYVTWKAARHHPNFPKEWDRLRALPFDPLKLDPLPTTKFLYESPEDERKQMLEKERRAKLKEHLKTLLAVVVIIINIFICRGMINGSVDKGGFVVLTLLWLGFVFYALYIIQNL